MSSDLLDVLNLQQRDAPAKKKQKVAEPKVKRMLLLFIPLLTGLNTNKNI